MQHNARKRNFSIHLIQLQKRWAMSNCELDLNGDREKEKKNPTKLEPVFEFWKDQMNGVTASRLNWRMIKPFYISQMLFGCVQVIKIEDSFDTCTGTRMAMPIYIVVILKFLWIIFFFTVTDVVVVVGL